MAKIQRIACGFVNCYLVTQKDKSILIDVAQTKYMDKLYNICKSKNIQLIILTHGHIDHIQNAYLLAEKLNAPIAMHKLDIELIDNNLVQPLYAHTILGKIVLTISKISIKNGTYPSFRPSICLEGNSSLLKYGIDARIIELPGHTNGSIGIEVEKKAVIVGDALMNMVFPQVSMLYTNRKLMMESVNKITELGDRVIYYGHGKSTKNKKWKK